MCRTVSFAANGYVPPGEGDGAGPTPPLKWVGPTEGGGGAGPAPPAQWGGEFLAGGARAEVEAGVGEGGGEGNRHGLIARGVRRQDRGVDVEDRDGRLERGEAPIVGLHAELARARAVVPVRAGGRVRGGEREGAAGGTIGVRRGVVVEVGR